MKLKNCLNRESRMKRVKLLPDRMTRVPSLSSPSWRLPGSVASWLLLSFLFLPCACSGGRGDEQQQRLQQAQLQQVVDKLSAIQAQLQRDRPLTGVRAVSKEQLRDVFQPLGDVVAQVVEQQQLDRQQWLAVVSDVRRLSRLLTAGVARKEQAELEAMRSRLDQIDVRLREQDRRSREAKAALIEALDAASGRLDGLLKEMTAPELEGDDGKGERKGEAKGGAKGGAKGEAKGETKGEGTGEGKGRGDGRDMAPGTNGAARSEATGEGSGSAFLVTFLAISLVLLVGLVVFFPNRLRPVPQIRYTARPEMASAWGERPTTSGEPSGDLADDSAAETPDLEHVKIVEATEVAEVASVATVALGALPAEGIEGIKAHGENEAPDKTAGTEGTAGTDGTAGTGETEGAEARKEATGSIEGHTRADTRDQAGGPKAVQFEIACPDPETAAERVAGFLSAEPRVLLHPGPDLEAREDSLALRFYLVPSVPAEQQSRIKAAIHALAREASGSGTVGAAQEPGQRGNDLPAA